MGSSILPKFRPQTSKQSTKHHHLSASCDHARALHPFVPCSCPFFLVSVGLFWATDPHPRALKRRNSHPRAPRAPPRLPSRPSGRSGPRRTPTSPRAPCLPSCSFRRRSDPRWVFFLLCWLVCGQKQHRKIKSNQIISKSKSNQIQIKSLRLCCPPPFHHSTLKSQCFFFSGVVVFFFFLFALSWFLYGFR